MFSFAKQTEALSGTAAAQWEPEEHKREREAQPSPRDVSPGVPWGGCRGCGCPGAEGAAGGAKRGFVSPAPATCRCSCG